MIQHGGQGECSEHVFQEVLHGIQEGVHIVNEQGVTIFYNQAASRIDGMESTEVLGTHVLEAFPSLTEKSSTLLYVLETGERLPDTQQTFLNQKGKQITTLNRTFPVHVEGRCLGAVEISRDYTQVRELSEEVHALREQVWKTVPYKEKKACLYKFEDFLTQHPALVAEVGKARKVAHSKAPVLIIGETGTGKEIISQSIHQLGLGKKKPFIVQNCAAIPSSLLESYLFGTEKGAFTGAEDRAGLFELADGGTLFLDEIHAMPIDLQAKLLRVLEDSFLRRVGSSKLRSVDVRVIAAINEDPWLAVESGKFRKDLFYRLHVVSIHLLPLRKRKEDLQLLTNYFLGNLSRQYSIPSLSLSLEVEMLFKQYDWPGNVRELRNVLEGAVHFIESNCIELRHLSRHMTKHSTQAFQRSSTVSLVDRLAEYESEMITQAMIQTEGKVSRAAEVLQIPRQTLQYKLRKLGMRRE
ncbi:sigma-54 interaction domain-containing protein [Baia soyae]|uniref:Arginine utilization regulatory protein n=1 Tax=Baia soyae TaxID=1544746 RepID=A0A4R2S2D0_9BACL|nr:sigma 54-interacting transcriptional regulator [Baia soyae]TCP69445.1 arginine utilization regulatory protein [Baia soyae]